MTFLKQKPVFINNLFDDFFANLPSESNKEIFTTPVNIYENIDGFTVELSASGCSKENFKINAEREILTISYEKKQDENTSEIKTLRKEFGSKNFKQSFSLENNVNVDGIKAKYENGILSVYLPKKETLKSQPKEIQVL